MAGSNSPFGNRGVSSLIRSAGSTQAAIQTMNDEVAAFNWENSGYSDAAFADYSKYLQSRIDSLNSSGTIQNASRAVSMASRLRSATHSNVSASITRENIQIMAGNATPQDKLNLIGDQFQRAVDNGDYTLAQSLESQGYSLSQTIQQQQVQAASAAKTLNDANNTAIKAGYSSAIDQIKQSIGDTLSLIHSGHDASGAIKQLNGTINDALKALGQPALPKGQSANIGSLIQGAFNAEFAYNQHASDALRASDPAAADKFAKYDQNGNIVGGAAYDIMSNKASISLPGVGNVNAADAARFAANPNLLGTKTDINGNTTFTRNQITGYQYVNGVLTPLADQKTASTIAQNATLDKNQQPTFTSSGKTYEKQLEALGFGSVKVNKDGTITATATDKTDKWLGYGGKNGDLASSGASIGRGNQITLIPQANGSFQFTHNNRLLNIATDQKGLGGIFETLPNGQNVHLAGQYGFNKGVNTLISNATTQQIKFNAQQAAAQAANAKLQATLQAAKVPTSSLYGQNTGPLNGGTQPPAFAGGKPGSPQMTQRAGGGFNFTYNGQAISAARYSQLTNTPFRNLLTTMAGQGDTGAKTALGFVGNDYGYDPSKVNSGNAGAYNALTWGIGKQQAAVSGPNIQGGKLTLPSGFKL